MTSHWREQPADEVSEVLLASAALAGIERLWFVSGTELAFLQEATVKNHALGRPAPRLMTMTHESVALAAACGETMVTGQPSAIAFHVEVGLLHAGAAIHNADRGNYPVLMMSGYAAQRSRVHDLTDASQPILQKPFSMVDLNAAVERALAPQDSA